VPALTNPL